MDFLLASLNYVFAMNWNLRGRRNIVCFAHGNYKFREDKAGKTNPFIQLISWAFPWIYLQIMLAKVNFLFLCLNFVNSSSNEHLPWSKLNVVLMGLESYSDAEMGSIMVYRCSIVKYQTTLSGIRLPYSSVMTISNI